MAQFEGIITAIITPFDEGGEIYRKGVENEIEYLHKEGIKNIFACGSYGAFPLMTIDQRIQMADWVIKADKERKMKTIVQVGSTRTEDAIRLAKHAEGCGAEAIAAVVPFYYSSTIYKEEHFLRYYETLIKTVSVPVHVYNNPQTTGFNVSPGFLGKLIDIGIRGIKDGGSDMDRMLEMMKVIESKGVDFDYYPSSTSSVVTGLLLGARSCISGVSLTVPKVMNEIFEASLRQDMVGAVVLYKRAMAVRSILNKHGGRAIAAFDVLHAKGVDVGTCKAPWQRFTREQAEWVVSELKRLEEI